jgi:tryptophan synthase alpha chain
MHTVAESPASNSDFLALARPGMATTIHTLSRIQQTFKRWRARAQGADSLHHRWRSRTRKTLPLMQALVAGGADIIELGVPFSDPMADGPDHPACFRTCPGCRHEPAPRAGAGPQNSAGENDQTPVVLMGYANPIEAYGVERFARDC